jgi:hypothetical protein
MFWLVGVVYAIAGIIVYIEYGLSIPRRKVHGNDVAIPRSGGDLNYVSMANTFNVLSLTR